MGIGVGTAMALSAVTSGASMIMQNEARKDAQGEQDKLEQEALDKEQAMFDQRAEDAGNREKATVEFGLPDDDDELGSYDDFLTPLQTPNAGLSSAGKSTSPLGF